MLKYKIRLDFNKRGRISHRRENFMTLFSHLLKLTRKHNLALIKYDEDNNYAYMEFENG